jgi:hypothetical protein
MIGIGIKALFGRTPSPEQYRHANLFILVLPRFNLEA